MSEAPIVGQRFGRVAVWRTGGSIPRVSRETPEGVCPSFATYLLIVKDASGSLERLARDLLNLFHRTAHVELVHRCGRVIYCFAVRPVLLYEIVIPAFQFIAARSPPKRSRVQTLRDEFAEVG